MSLSLSQLFKTCLDLEGVTIPQSVQGYTEQFQLGCRVLILGLKNFKTSFFPFQNQEIVSEGDLVASLNQSDKVRELQDKIASLRAQVSHQNS